MLSATRMNVIQRGDAIHVSNIKSSTFYMCSSLHINITSNICTIFKFREVIRNPYSRRYVSACGAMMWASFNEHLLRSFLLSKTQKSTNRVLQVRRRRKNSDASIAQFANHKIVTLCRVIKNNGIMFVVFKYEGAARRTRMSALLRTPQIE